MASSHVPTALVTGASAGIGRASVAALAQAGFLTYATARRPEALAELTAEGFHALSLDVTDDRSVAAAIAAVEREHGGLDLLVCSAGYGQLGPVEEVSMDAWRAQFETNVFGVVRLVQRALPGMRRRGRGRIVVIGSMGGEVTFPLSGAYHASKYALEAVCDALRVEVAPFGVAVSLIQPGGIRTGFEETSARRLESDPAGPYAAVVNGFREQSRRVQRSRFTTDPPELVARAVVRAAQAQRPKSRYKVGKVARPTILVRHAITDRMWDRIAAGIFRPAETT